MHNEQELFRIGTVASLTGVSVERLRAWERRYDMIPAHKEGKTRFYSHTQLEKLKVIKQLIDQGHAISSLVSLSIEQLHERSTLAQDKPTLFATTKPSIGLLGAGLINLAHANAIEQNSRIEISYSWANANALFSEHNGHETPQVLFAQLPVLDLQTIDFIRNILPDTTIIAIYQYATAKQVGDIEAANIRAVKWPISWAELEHLAISESHYQAPPINHANHLYSDEELIAIAASEQHPSGMAQHLVDAICQLNALGAYAHSCAIEPLPEQGNADSSVAVPTVTELQSTQQYKAASSEISFARAQLEQTLSKLLNEDSDEIPESGGSRQIGDPSQVHHGSATSAGTRFSRGSEDAKLSTVKHISDKPVQNLNKF